MIIFNVDLDNTLIYSYKHDIGSKKRCVEIYQGREISYITERTYELLRKVKEKVLMVPTTTRTIEQYERIDLQIGAFPYALACNGGVLLIDGKEDETWYQDSLELVKDCSLDMEKAIGLLEQDANRSFEIRYIKELFIFTKSDRPEETIHYLSSRLDTSLVDVFSNGVKVYVVPKVLNKGLAAKRLKEKLSGDLVIAAGDSEFDISMLDFADHAIMPEALDADIKNKESVTVIPKERLFSEGLLEWILDEEVLL
ncbi:MAG: HAD hydrolase family protein [Agathobacter sp.]|nr:HAD hydrolase family protein [Agathobacter sp.]